MKRIYYIDYIEYCCHHCRQYCHDKITWVSLDRAGIEARATLLPSIFHPGPSLAYLNYIIIARDTHTSKWAKKEQIVNLPFFLFHDFKIFYKKLATTTSRKWQGVEQRHPSTHAQTLWLLAKATNKQTNKTRQNKQPQSKNKESLTACRDHCSWVCNHDISSMQ